MALKPHWEDQHYCAPECRAGRPAGQERASGLAWFHFIKEKEPFPGVGEHCLCQPQLPGGAPQALGRGLVSQKGPHPRPGLASRGEGLRRNSSDRPLPAPSPLGLPQEHTAGGIKTLGTSLGKYFSFHV